jgi:hypothetical protein
MSKVSGRRQGRQNALLGACLIVAAMAGCLEPSGPGLFSDNRPGEFVQEGTVVVRDGEEAQVYFKKPFDAPPQIEVTGFVQSWFKTEPFSKKSFEIVQPATNNFKIRSTHSEQALGSFAEIKWKATGTKARKKALTEMKPHERVMDQVEKLGGRVRLDDKQPGGPIVEIDLHQTRTRDTDLEMLHGLTSLRTLNLFGTSITDAGLTNLAGLTKLEKLYLNNTSVTDAGVEHLRGLTGLKELSLYGTKVTDDGLRHVAALRSLQSLTLGGRQITDQGLKQLMGLKELKQISLSGTNVTPAGVSELQRHWPKLQVIR